MPTWWTSVDSVARLNTVVLACAAIFGFLAAGFVVASWFTGSRLADLQDLELSDYKSQVEQEKLARLEIEKRLADRRISREQADQIRQSLAPFKGHKLTLTLMQSNPEVITFGNELRQALSAAGFDLKVTSAALLLGGPTHPLSIIYGKNRVAEANAIGLALLSSGVIDGTLPAVVATDDDGLNLAVRPK